MFIVQPNCAEIVFTEDFRFNLRYVDCHLLRTWMIGNILTCGPATAVFSRNDALNPQRAIKFVYKRKTPHDPIATRLSQVMFEVVIDDTAVTLDQEATLSGVIDTIGQVIGATATYPFYAVSAFLNARQRNDVFYLDFGHSFIAGHDIYCFGEPQGWNEIRLNGDTPKDDWVQRVDIAVE